MNIIQSFILKNTSKIFNDFISSPYDLIGNGKVSYLMPLCSMLLKKSLSNNPTIAITRKGVDVRKKTFFIINKISPYFIKEKQVVENKHKLIDDYSVKEETFVNLPNDPVIYVSNHGFYDDVAATVNVVKRPTYLITDSISELFNSISGIAIWIMGVVLLNNKLKSSRQSSIEKAKLVLKYGSDVIIFPEGVWNRTPNLLALPLHRGVYILAKETGAKIVPVIHYLSNQFVENGEKIIHTIIDDPISVDNMTQEEALQFLRDKFAYWYYLLMEKYGRCSRNDIIENNQSSREIWLKNIKKQCADDKYYDYYLCQIADYRDKRIVRPNEAFEPIANIAYENINMYNIKMILYAKKIVEIYKNEDYQRIV